MFICKYQGKLFTMTETTIQYQNSDL